MALRYKFLSSVFSWKLIKTFNSYLRVVRFFYLPFANSEKNPANQEKSLKLARVY